MPSIRASKLVASCPRCQRPIRPNAPIEEFYRDQHTGQVRYAHVGCRPSPVAGVTDLRDGVVIDPQDANGDVQAGDVQEDDAPALDAVAPAALDILKVGALVRDCIGEAHARLSRELGEQVGRQQADVQARVEEMVKGVVDEVKRSAAAHMANVTRKLRDALDGLEKHQAVKKVVVVQHPGGVLETDPDEVFHPAFDRVLRLAVAGKPVFMPGPTGAGKTHLARQVARYVPNPDGTVGRPFGSVSCRINMPDYELLGRAMPDVQTGKFVYYPSDFVRCFEQGGVFLLDEVDAGDSNALLTINSAVANGFLPIPARNELPEGVTWEQFKAAPGEYPGYGPTAYRHPNFVLLAAANTWGQGADRLYVGRNQLDEATLDRFRSYVVAVNYDEAAERRFCPEQGLFDVLTEWRKKIFEARLERVLSTRTVREAYDSVVRLKCQTIAEFAESFFGGWADTEVVSVAGRDLRGLLETLRDVSF